MGILYNYKPYEQLRKGIFSVETGEYKLPVGWVGMEKEFLIIGETDETYVTQLIEPEKEESDIVPIGLHKSRLIQWKETQLELFI